MVDALAGKEAYSSCYLILSDKSRQVTFLDCSDSAMLRGGRMRMVNDFYRDMQTIFRKSHVRRMLDVLNEQETSGWEKWLQFELMRYYHDLDHEPYKEQGYDKNQQHKADNITNRIDLVYRKKNWNTVFYNGVEIKVMRPPQYSIKGILKDLVGVSQIKTSLWELRAVTGLSVYSTEIMNETREYSRYKNFVNSLTNAKRAKLLECNGWSCLVLGWESKAISTKKIMKEEYKSYLQSIGGLANKHDIGMG